MAVIDLDSERITDAICSVVRLARGADRVIVHLFGGDPDERAAVARGAAVELGARLALIGRAPGWSESRIADAGQGLVAILTSDDTRAIRQNILAALPGLPIVYVELPKLPRPAASGSLAGINFTAVDFETANGKRASPCSVGLAKIRDGEVVHFASQFIMPPKPYSYFSPRNFAVHGIRWRDCASAPGFGATLDWMIEYVGGDTMVAHNVAFDRSVVEKTCEAIDRPAPWPNWVCTLKLSKTHVPTEAHKLPIIGEYFGLPTFEHHEAGADAAMAGKIMIELIRAFGVASPPSTDTTGEWAPPVRPAPVRR